MTFDAVILAGGKSTRMGRDKAWLEFDGRTLLARQIQLARGAGASGVFVSGRAGKDYSGFGCPALVDRLIDIGPLAGVERALSACSAPLLLALAVDMPRMTPAPLQKLLSLCAQDRGAVPRVNNEIEPLAAFYPRAALALLTGRLDRRLYSARQFAGACIHEKLCVFVDFTPDDAPFFENWNAPDAQSITQPDAG